MKKIISLLFIISFVLAASGQNVARIDTGTVNHAAYKILFPKEWHRKLILFAHGYEFMGSPSSINGEQFLGPFFCVWCPHEGLQLCNHIMNNVLLNL